MSEVDLTTLMQQVQLLLQGNSSAIGSLLQKSGIDPGNPESVQQALDKYGLNNMEAISAMINQLSGCFSGEMRQQIGEIMENMMKGLGDGEQPPTELSAILKNFQKK